MKKLLILMIIAALFALAGCTEAAPDDTQATTVAPATTTTASAENPTQSQAETMPADDPRFDAPFHLESIGTTQYFWIYEGEACALYAREEGEDYVKKLGVFAYPETEEEESNGSGLVINQVAEVGGRVVVAVGEYAGSASYFYGYFASVDKNGGEPYYFDITDTDSFVATEDWIYYNSVADTEFTSLPSGIWRIRSDGTDNQRVGDDRLLSVLYYDGEYLYATSDTGEMINGYNPLCDLVLCGLEGENVVKLFPAKDLLPFDEESEHAEYSFLYAEDDTLEFTVTVHGYTVGENWRGHDQYVARYSVGKDGTKLTLISEDYM